MVETAPDPDTNAAIWSSDEAIARWTASMDAREAKLAPQWRLIAELLPFAYDAPFRFCDLGAGTGAAARAILSRYPNSEAVLADFSAKMRDEATRVMAPFAGRYRYVELDLLAGSFPETIPADLDAAVTSHCVHHLPDDAKAALFASIHDHLRPGGWYLNFDPVVSSDPVVADAWRRAGDRLDPEAAERARHRTPEEQAHYENHVRHLAPLAPQLGALGAAGFEAVEVYWKQLDAVIFGGRRPLPPS